MKNLTQKYYLIFFKEVRSYTQKIWREKLIWVYFELNERKFMQIGALTLHPKN